MTTIANEKIRRIMRDPQRKPLRRWLARINPMMVCGAFLAGAVLFHVATIQVGNAIQCVPGKVVRS